MTDPVNDMFDWILSAITGHPSSGRLMDLATGGPLDPVIVQHLDGCPSCRETMIRLRQDWERLVNLELAADSTAQARPDGVLERILIVVRSMAPPPTIPATDASERGRRLSRWLTGEMDAYFGLQACALAGDSGSAIPDLHRTLARAGDLLCTFLGRRAAVMFTDGVLSEVRSQPV